MFVYKTNSQLYQGGLFLALYSTGDKPSFFSPDLDVLFVFLSRGDRRFEKPGRKDPGLYG